MDQKKLRIGFIGTGGIANAHMKAYLRRTDIEIVALCDIVPGKAEAFGKAYKLEGVTCYESHEEMLDKETLDAVSVCTYNAQHAAPTIYALNKGVHVLCEKPFSVTLDEAADMMRAEKASGKILSIGFQPRFDANMQKIKKIVESGELGQVYYIQTGGGRRRGIPCSSTKTSFIEKETAGVGALGDIGCYSLDMVLNAIGYPTPLTVSGFVCDFFGKNPETYRYSSNDPEYLAEKFSVDDFSGALIRLEGGIVLDFRIAWAMNINTPGDTVILGTKAGLRIPSTDCWNGSVGGEMTLYRHCAGSPVECKIPLVKEDLKGATPGEALWDRKIGAFVEAIQNGTPSPIPTSEILKNQAIIDGIVRSAACGREVEIVMPEI